MGLTKTPDSERGKIFEVVSQLLLRPSPRGCGYGRFWKSGLGLTCQNLPVSWKEMEIKRVCTHLASAEAMAAVPTLGSGSRHRIWVYGSAPARSAGNKPASIALCAWALAVVLAALI